MKKNKKFNKCDEEFLSSHIKEHENKTMFETDNFKARCNIQYQLIDMTSL